MRYVGWEQIAGRPNVIVDGYGTDGTVLTLSHWPDAGSPEELADDLSTQIAFRYLDRPDLAVDADLVSNNHYDEDGLCGIYALVAPDAALARRDRIIDVASAGDFGTFADRSSARVVFTLEAFGDPDRSPLGSDTFTGSYLKTSSNLYEELLGRLPEILDHLERFESLWTEQDAVLERSEERVRAGAITIEERPEIDLAIVRVPEDTEACHPMAVNNRTDRHRILTVHGARCTLGYRYETWVRYVSRPTVARVDLTPLAEELSTLTGGSWSFGGVDDITPRLSQDGSDTGNVSPDVIVERTIAFLERSRS